MTARISNQNRLPSAAGLKSAAKRVARHVRAKSLMRYEALSRMFDLDVWLKIETTTPIGSFKLRGAFNAVLDAPSHVGMLITSSTGNHSLGVAYAANLLGMECKMYLPAGSNIAKMSKIESMGAEIVTVGRDLSVQKT